MLAESDEQQVDVCCVPFQSPLDADLVIDMVQDGVRLLFDPKQQRLKVRTGYKTTQSLILMSSLFR